MATLFSPLFASESFWMPRKASTVAGQVDGLYNFILLLSAIFFVLIIGATVLFVLKYRYRGEENVKTSPLAHSLKLELVWSAIPSVLLLAIFAWGFTVWMNINIVPSDNMEIRVNAARWSWSFSYPRHGVNGSAELIVPADTNIKLVMISSDVLHSFFVPEFRVKRDVLPKRYSTVWFHTPSKALTRLQKVKPEKLQLANVVKELGFAADLKNAATVIKGGHIMVNNVVVSSPTQQVKLHDVIEVKVDAKLRKSLLAKEKAHAKKMKKLKADDERAVAQKKFDAEMKKVTPHWLRTVLSAMKAAKEIQERFQKNELTAADLPKLRADWLYADIDGLRSMYGFVSDAYNVNCTEYCGKEHSKMITRVRVVSPKLFGIWLKRTLSKGATGPELIARYGCGSCHSVKDNSVKVGPSFKGIYGRKRTYTDANGKVASKVLDKEFFKTYIRESILNPQAKVVAGFANQKMPTFKGRIKQEEIDILIDYLEGLR